jgi:hypothetical protein
MCARTLCAITVCSAALDCTEPQDGCQGAFSMVRMEVYCSIYKLDRVSGQRDSGVWARRLHTQALALSVSLAIGTPKPSRVSRPI